MSPVRKTLASLPSKRTFLLFFALTTVGLAGNHFRYPIFFGLDFLFGSIFAMLALQMVGFLPGTIAAFLISTITFSLWNHPYAIVIMTGEALVAGLLVRRKNVGLVAADAIYWVCIGIPLIYFFYHIVMHLTLNNTGVTMMKQSINGIFNALIARLIFLAWSFRFKKTLFSFREVIFNLLALFVLAPSLLLLGVQSKSEVADTDRAIRQALLLASRRVTGNIESFQQEHMKRIVYLSRIARTHPLVYLQRSIEQIKAADDDFLSVGVLNNKADTIAFSPPVDESGRSTIGRSFADRPYIPAMKQTLRPLLSEVVIAKIGLPQPIVVMAAPIISNGRYDGYAVGVLDLNKVKKNVFLNAQSQALPGLLYTLVDRNNRIIITNREGLKPMDAFTRGPGDLSQKEEDIYQWFPLSRKNISVSERWESSLYVNESAIGKLSEWKLILEQPIAPFQEKLYTEYSARLVLVFLIFLTALALADLMSRKVVFSLEALKDITSDLPTRLYSSLITRWPESMIRETNQLVGNFRDMSGTLARQFHEINAMNASLEIKVEERTRALKESEWRYRLLAENTTDVVWQLDLGINRFTYVSPSVFQLRGYTPEEVIAQPVEASLTPESQKRVQAWIGNALQEFANGRTDPSQELKEVEQPRKDGTTVWTEVSTTYILKDGNRPVGIVGISRDISERRRAEQRLQVQHALLTAILNSSRDIIIFSLDGNYCYTTFNEKHREEMKRVWNVEIAIGMNLLECMKIPELRESAKQSIDRALRGETLFEEQHQPEPDIYYEFIWNPVVQDKSIVGVTVFIRDISERKRVEAALRESETHFRRIIEFSPIPIGLVDKGGKVLYFNDRFIKTFGYTIEDVSTIDAWWQAAYPDEQYRRWVVDTWSSAVRRAGEERADIKPIEYRVTCKDKAVRIVEISGIAIEDNILATFIDITERRSAEEKVREALREKETLLREIHHRVKNNMQVVSSLLDLQAQKIAEPSLKDMFQESQRRVKSMALIHEKLYQTKSLSEIDFGDYIAALVRELETSFNTEARRISTIVNAMPIALNIESAMPCALIINELLTNAYKHAFPGREGGEVRVIFFEADEIRTLSIQDDGIGLPKGFDVAKTVSLGFQLIGVLVKQLQGSIQVVSNGGTVVTIVFKRKGASIGKA